MLGMTPHPLDRSGGWCIIPAMTPPAAPPPWSQADLAEYVRLWNAGEDYASIAAVMGRSEAACQKRRRLLGLPARMKCKAPKVGRPTAFKRPTEADITALYAGQRYQDVPPEVIERENVSKRFCQRVYRPATYLPRNSE